MESEQKKEQQSKKRPMTEGEWYVIGNFKIKRIRLIVDSKNNTRELLPTAKMTQKYLEKNRSTIINAVKISDHDELWQLRIPATFEAYNIIVALYEGGEKDDENILQTLLCNFANTTTVMNGLFHNLILNVASIYVTKINNNLSREEKKREYFKVLKLAMGNVLSDLEISDEEKEKMERANEEFDKFMAGTIKNQLNEEKGN